MYIKIFKMRKERKERKEGMKGRKEKPGPVPGCVAERQELCAALQDSQAAVPLPFLPGRSL